MNHKYQIERPENFFSHQRDQGRGRFKLDADRVRDIRKRLAAGETHQHIADTHDPRLGKSTVSNISNGQTWGWVQ